MNSVTSSLSACLGSVVLGAALSYPSPAIPNLNAHKNPFHIGSQAQSWISSIVTISALASSLVAGPIVDRGGRKLALMLTAVPNAIGWAIVASSDSALMMMMGRLLTGIAIGVWDVAAPTYIAEIVPAKHRGLLGSCHELSINLGIVLIYLFGYFLPWNWLAVVSCTILAFMMCLLPFVPETPRWLLLHQRRQEAIDTLVCLRGSEQGINDEILEIEQTLPEPGMPRVTLADFRHKSIYRPTLIISGLMLFHCFTGIDAILAYTVDIFRAAQVTNIDPYLQTVMVGIVGFSGNLISTLIIDSVGRRILLIVSGATITLSMAALGSYFLLLQNLGSFAPTHFFWLPVGSLVVYHFSFTLAYGPIPFLMMSELLPNRARARATGFVIALYYAGSFIVTKFFIEVNEATQDCGSYFIFTVSTAISIVFVLYFVPETKCKTLEEIERYFQ